MSRRDQIKLGFILHGVGPGWDDWRHPDARTDASTSFDFYSHQARVAEAGKFDFLFVADSLFITARSSPHDLNRFEPLTILSARLARDEGLTLRQTALRVATPRSHFVGDPEQVADALQRWFEAGAADGYILFESLPGQLELFVESVVPILQDRGVYRRDYQGATLRDHLGLPFKENRHTVVRGRLAAE